MQTPLDYACEMASKFETLWEAQLALGEIPSVLVPGNILEHCESESEPEPESEPESILSWPSALQNSHYCIALSPASSELMCKSEAVAEEEEEEEEVLQRCRRSIPQQEQFLLQRPCIQSQLSFIRQTLTEKPQENDTIPLSAVAQLSPSPSLYSVTSSLSSSKRRSSPENNEYLHERKDSGVFEQDNKDGIIIKLISETNGAESNLETEAAAVPTLDKEGGKELIEGVEAESRSDHITLKSETMNSSSYFSRSRCDDVEHMSEFPTLLTSVS
ncbi:hypothetical protein BG011_002003 [Mortierella polycephala]|uniref:Uncharacterized protein n=1 Tax=Mortierella polycephala TaxID=41804 RepID=A0A9P6QDX9_9FUNG|nr:hypothetical protein BG011_002003 [Mortierella polycephala]